MCDFSEFLEADRIYWMIKFTEKCGEEGRWSIVGTHSPRNGYLEGQSVLGLCVGKTI